MGEMVPPEWITYVLYLMQTSLQENVYDDC